MKKELSISEIFTKDAFEIANKRKDSLFIHSKNIRAAGDEVEIFVRDYFRKRVPKRYHVAQGHLIDDECRTSPQLDVIVSDTANLPSLLTTEDGTEFIPIDSTYIIGEIKSSYIKSKKYIQKFSKTLKAIHNDLHHEELINTAFYGITPESTIRDTFLEGKHRILNSIFSFVIFIDSGDFCFSEISSFLASTDNKYLPNLIVLLNKGIIQKARITDTEVVFTYLPNEPEYSDYEWVFVPIYGDDERSISGNILSVLYLSLIQHLSNSFLEPPSFERFIKKRIGFDRTRLERVKPS
jgi:hypothetical protein